MHPATENGNGPGGFLEEGGIFMLRNGFDPSGFCHILGKRIQCVAAEHLGLFDVATAGWE